MEIQWKGEDGNTGVNRAVMGVVEGKRVRILPCGLLWQLKLGGGGSRTGGNRRHDNQFEAESET